jgi:hypothetical protein
LNTPIGNDLGITIEYIEHRRRLVNGLAAYHRRSRDVIRLAQSLQRATLKRDLRNWQTPKPTS